MVPINPLSKLASKGQANADHRIKRNEAQLPDFAVQAETILQLAQTIFSDGTIAVRS
ncbi:hypothetical protein VOI32_39190 [Paraburkholderia caribensis]|uniref:Uncharacterized protein n=1 Tax=Paraburkholderia caribensis TaxID=75105 RepID=A0ABV0E8Z4_9BURK|nr:hypothetical protein [Paraburkholderia caribensis]MCO4882703.1 hypothetical protein [Paraburkholderia caribensis]